MTRSFVEKFSKERELIGPVLLPKGEVEIELVRSLSLGETKRTGPDRHRPPERHLERTF
jgi:hypothetical protein